ncbi:DUF1778 domain-containing protein [Dolichospermum sp. LEGE 00240]|jgi:uncharacterized protein (DUF1778 family)|uniref:type II toxin-antitoxin system TacA family antitoxin n=1 Tax=Dolichospermum sp. LEGE 00240 TaxID=1828603 RepID=UPI0018806869|nr:DUF1778 domain-containing protein [Dolichospermum sp. LEGE 00240]MDM3843579.1 DUF1778 domain-containing protein [Aphanizomenon gracile PMC638.10]MDM3851244.1 DUF1778 domain-containing protein [Aphanizomenon gracile PMC627.10]MDM3854144.1 DUF1778 domain-containing protein [Aphanizomenon gracile PMC649.10]MDM3860181.1 DUF1778 domain-containing protein [Aphanizomenon gracile PMC644.10]MBE9249822.1 DUF1778 domain-containing protein [Dolichospermum sp. LEGE 00240]
MTHSVARNSPEKSLRSKSERLEARISPENKELFQRAADIQGRTLTDFVVSSLVSAANQIIQENEIMVLSRKDQEVFVEALLNPPKPSEKLQLAAQRYKKNMGV